MVGPPVGVSIWLSFTLYVLNMHTQLLNCICVYSHMVIPSEARLESGSIESRGGCSTLSTIPQKLLCLLSILKRSGK